MTGTHRVELFKVDGVVAGETTSPFPTAHTAGPPQAAPRSCPPRTVRPAPLTAQTAACRCPAASAPPRALVLRPCPLPTGRPVPAAEGGCRRISQGHAPGESQFQMPAQTVMLQARAASAARPPSPALTRLPGAPPDPHGPPAGRDCPSQAAGAPLSRARAHPAHPARGSALPRAGSLAADSCFTSSPPTRWAQLGHLCSRGGQGDEGQGEQLDNAAGPPPGPHLDSVMDMLRPHSLMD